MLVKQIINIIGVNDLSQYVSENSKQEQLSTFFFLLNPFSQNQYCANSVDPDKTAQKSCLIRIYTVCHSVFDLD